MLTANVLNNTLGMGVVGKLFTDVDSNSKPWKKDKLNHGGSNRSTHMIEGKGAGTTKEHHLVTKVLGMGHNFDDCSISHQGPDRLMCHATCQTRQQSARRC